MNIYNIDKKECNLNIYLGKDCEVFEVSIFVDGYKKTVTLSNKGIYSVYLGLFSQISVSNHEHVTYKLVERTNKYNKFYKKFKISLEKSVPDSIVIKGENYIFDDLRENNGNDLYCSFNRLLKITLKYVETKDFGLLEDIKYGLEFLMNNWYTGKVNYQGNWWFYEIGVPR